MFPPLVQDDPGENWLQVGEKPSQNVGDTRWAGGNDIILGLTIAAHDLFAEQVLL